MSQLVVTPFTLLQTSHNTLLASSGSNFPMMILVSVLFHSSKTALRSNDNNPAKFMSILSLVASLARFSAAYKREEE